MQILRYVTALCWALALVSCAVPLNRSVNASIDNIVKDNGKEHGIPAQAVVVLRNSETVYRQHWGTSAINGGFPVNEETVFPVFSVSKLFAATLLMQLVEDGQVNLDAPASRYVADMPPSWRAIKVEQFLNHVSGIPEYFDPANLDKPFLPSLRDVFESLSKQPFIEIPGTRTRYTSTNFLVIQSILESTTGRSYGDLVNQRIILPLALKSTWLGLDAVPRARLVADYHGENDRAVPDIPIAWPAYSLVHGNLYSTASDIARFLTAVVEGRFVTVGTLQRLWRPYSFPNGKTGYFASGWEYGESGAWKFVGHDGGAKVRVRIFFKDNIDPSNIIVYLTNGSRDNVWSRTLVESVQELVLPP